LLITSGSLLIVLALSLSLVLTRMDGDPTAVGALIVAMLAAYSVATCANNSFLAFVGMDGARPVQGASAEANEASITRSSVINCILGAAGAVLFLAPLVVLASSSTGSEADGALPFDALERIVCLAALAGAVAMLVFNAPFWTIIWRHFDEMHDSNRSILIFHSTRADGAAEALLKPRENYRSPNRQPVRTKVGHCDCGLEFERRDVCLILGAMFFACDAMGTLFHNVIVFARSSLGLGAVDCIQITLANRCVSLAFGGFSPGLLMLLERWTLNRVRPTTKQLYLALYIASLLCPLLCMRMKTRRDFLVLQTLLACVGTGTYILGRSILALVAPPGRATSIFSLSVLLSRASGFIGPAIFAAASARLGSARAGYSALAAQQFVAVVLLAAARVPDGTRVAGLVDSSSAGEAHFKLPSGRTTRLLVMTPTPTDDPAVGTDQAKHFAGDASTLPEPRDKAFAQADYGTLSISATRESHEMSASRRAAKRPAPTCVRHSPGSPSDDPECPAGSETSGMHGVRTTLAAHLLDSPRRSAERAESRRERKIARLTEERNAAVAAFRRATAAREASSDGNASKRSRVQTTGNT
jgi:MFS-type transporter involved in bile tolerance (Atg22 family)